MRYPTAEIYLHLILLLLFGSTCMETLAADQQSLLTTSKGSDSAILGDSPFFRKPLLLRSNSKVAAEKLFRSAVHKHANSDLNGAIADYLAAITLDDKKPYVHWYLGTAYETAGKPTAALLEFEKEQAMKQTINGAKRTYSGGYGNGSGRDGYSGGDFGSNRMKFIPGEGMTKVRY